MIKTQMWYSKWARALSWWKCRFRNKQSVEDAERDKLDGQKLRVYNYFLHIAITMKEAKVLLGLQYKQRKACIKVKIPCTYLLSGL